MNNTGEVTEQNWQNVTKLNGVKNAIMQVTYFLNSLFLICYFIVNILFYIKVK